MFTRDGETLTDRPGPRQPHPEVRHGRHPSGTAPTIAATGSGTRACTRRGSGGYTGNRRFPIPGWDRDRGDYREKYERARREGKFTCLVFREPYEAVREFLGTDGMLGLMAEDPALVREMFAHNCRITLEMIDLLDSLGMRMDGYWVWGDIAYTGGMFFSPSMYRELLMPVHSELFGRLGKYFIYHTDGNMRTCLPLLVEAGIRGINPIEIKAGNDFFEISERYGDRIVLTGGMDVTILGTNVRTEIEREVRTKLQGTRGKKYIFHSDHSIPPVMSLDSYRYLMGLVDEHGRR